jgi:hypothetical protein
MISPTKTSELSCMSKYSVASLISVTVISIREFSGITIGRFARECGATGIKSVQATASLLASGVDAHGVVVMDYGDFSVTLQHSKVSDSVLASEIQGEAGSLVIEKLSECQKVCFVPRGSQMQDLTQPQHINTMLYEESCSLPWWMSIWWIIQGWRSVASQPNC